MRLSKMINESILESTIEELNLIIDGLYRQSLKFTIPAVGFIGLSTYLYEDHPFASGMLLMSGLYCTRKFVNYFGMGLIINYEANKRENDQKDTE